MSVVNNSVIFYKESLYSYIAFYVEDTLIALNYGNGGSCYVGKSDLDTIGWVSLAGKRLGSWDENPFNLP